MTKHLNIFVFEILGLTKPDKTENKDSLLENTLEILLKIRNKARKDKDFETADLIRNELNDVGISLEDKKDKSNFNIN